MGVALDTEARHQEDLVSGRLAERVRLAAMEGGDGPGQVGGHLVMIALSSGFITMDSPKVRKTASIGTGSGES
jgi:hypothetical protein